MKKLSLYTLIALLTLLALSISACATAAGAQVPADSPVPSTPTNVPVSASQSFTDPFAYCANVGTIDNPDARYTGPAVPESIINGFKKAAGLENSTMPMDMFQKTTIWRCMDSQVYACNFGANLPCSSKANTDKTPTQAMADFCQANPTSDFIPMVVTGHSTIYSWHCVQGTPELLDQIEKVDAQGYLAGIWYALSPNP